MMKKSLLLLSILFFAKIIVAQTLVASYPFSGNANDASTYANNGMVTGASLTTDRLGNANSAYSFTGGTNQIAAPDQVWLNLTNTFTVEGWIYPTATPPAINSGTCFTIASKDVGPGDNQRKWIFGLQNGALAFNINGPGLGSGEWTVSSTFSLQLNQWYYCVASKNGNTVNYYINGASIGSATYTGTLLDPAGAPLTIGYSEPGLSTTGKLDDIKIHNIALSAQTIFDNYVNDVKKPGSGNGLQQTRTGALATDPWVNIGSGYDFGTQPFTYETWVKRDDLHTTISNNGIAFFVSEPNNGWGIGIVNTNTLFFTKVGVNAVFSTGTIADTKWHHVAVVYTGTQIQFYIDGVAAGATNYTGNFTGGGNYTIGARRLFGNSNGDQTINGMFDETRIWKNVVLTQTEIRDWMCRKITSAHPAYNNLFAYFRFDDNNGPVINGFGTKFGTFNNNPLLQSSGASIGDASAHDYVNATKTANISHFSGDNFDVTSTSGLPDGIQVFRVDEQPNTLNGAVGVGANSKYFGVFQCGGTTPQYTAVYNYSGNSSITPAIEDQLRLNFRNDNSTGTWTLLPDAANEPANTITVTGQSTEYILGSIGSPLPVTLLNFTGSKCNAGICLLWYTENDQNFSHFELEKSTDGRNFFYLADINVRNGAGTKSYNGVDNNPAAGDNYYRLKIVENNRSFSYSAILKINFNRKYEISITPNPAHDYIIINGADKFKIIQLVNAGGNIVSSFAKNAVNRYNISGLPAGIYLLRLINDRDQQVQKIIIK